MQGKYHNDPNAVHLADFYHQLIASVNSVSALVAKVTEMLNNPDSTDYVEPGTHTKCACDEDLRDHLQDILDNPEFAKDVFNGDVVEFCPRMQNFW